MKFICLIAAAITGLAVASTCPAQNGTGESNRKKIVLCSTTQIADFARNVVGDRWEVKCVLGPKQDPHTYTTNTDDSRSASQADLLLENGWNLEGHRWMAKLAQKFDKPIVTCVTGIEPLQTEKAGETKKDPHAWMNTANAWIYVQNIRDAVAEIDPKNAGEYESRAALYGFQLRALENWIKRQTNQIPLESRLLVTHHDAFGYFCQAYQFRSISPAGWSTEEIGGIGVNQTKKIVDQIRSLGIRSIFIESSLNPKLINKIANQAGVEVGGNLYSDAMGAEGSAAETYIGMMRENVLAIVSGLK